MEIEDIRKELNHLLNSVVEHSTRYSDERPIPSLEISFVMTKINKMKDNLVVLKYLLEEQEKALKSTKNSERKVPDTTVDVIEDKKEETVIIEEESETLENSNATLADNHEQSLIPKLMDALTLNDRYLYANELFNKDMNAFNEMVKSIDNSSSLDEAMGLFSSLILDNENEHLLSFTSLVERRFS